MMREISLNDALDRIHSECLLHNHCDKCPLHVEFNKCMLTTLQPNQWNLHKTDDK